jgi:hypothetical protein
MIEILATRYGRDGLSESERRELDLHAQTLRSQAADPGNPSDARSRLGPIAPPFPPLQSPHSRVPAKAGKPLLFPARRSRTKPDPASRGDGRGNDEALTRNGFSFLLRACQCAPGKRFPWPWICQCPPSPSRTNCRCSPTWRSSLDEALLREIAPPTTATLLAENYGAPAPYNARRRQCAAPPNGFPLEVLEILVPLVGTRPAGLAAGWRKDSCGHWMRAFLLWHWLFADRRQATRDTSSDTCKRRRLIQLVASLVRIGERAMGTRRFGFLALVPPCTGRAKAIRRSGRGCPARRRLLYAEPCRARTAPRCGLVALVEWIAAREAADRLALAVRLRALGAAWRPIPNMRPGKAWVALGSWLGPTRPRRPRAEAPAPTGAWLIRRKASPKADFPLLCFSVMLLTGSLTLFGFAD